FDPAQELAGPRVDSPAQAANVLLKTLEEPPPATHFVLVTAEPKRLPVTVLSRCQRVRFQPLDQTVQAELRARAGLVDAEAEAARQERLAQLLLASRSKEARVLFEAAGELGGDREEAQALCAALWTRLRDALLVREQLAGGR